MNTRDVPTQCGADAVLRPAMQALLDALAAPGTRWHSHAALVVATKLPARALERALADGIEASWVVIKAPAPGESGWRRRYSITTLGEQALQGVEQLGLGLVA